MTNQPNTLTWTAYQDGDRYVVGAKEWQTCTSMTFGIIDAYSAKEAASFVRRARITPQARIDEMKRTFWTDSRFETACDAGLFGADW